MLSDAVVIASTNQPDMYRTIDLQRDYWDGMTASEWVLWAQRLNWLIAESQSSSEDE